MVAYIVAAAVIVGLFTLIKRAMGGKLLGSDIFGPTEYYLGMGSGMVRFLCILLCVLAVLNSRYYSPTEVKAMQKFQDDVYGSNVSPSDSSRPFRPPFFKSPSPAPGSNETSRFC